MLAAHHLPAWNSSTQFWIVQLAMSPDGNVSQIWTSGVGSSVDVTEVSPVDPEICMMMLYASTAVARAVSIRLRWAAANRAADIDASSERRRCRVGRSLRLRVGLAHHPIELGIAVLAMTEATAVGMTPVDTEVGR